LKRFSKTDHLHLIKLLVTFKWREQFYLLFPWAEGNLLDFWKKFDKLSCPERDYNLALWFSKQCLGIVQGLNMIHTADIPSESTQIPLGAPKYRIHGRHGDLKPENILWFKSYKETEETWHGVLKISDFGLTRFRGTQSMSQFEITAVSPTYRAPEYDIVRTASQSYDVWSLGCVLLEFVTWYLLGWEGVDTFSKDRTTDDRQEIPEDVFFNFISIKDQNGKPLIGARAKLSVADVGTSVLLAMNFTILLPLDTDLPNLQEIQILYEHKNCSDFLLDLLAFIKEQLLRINPRKRAKCQEIVEKFEELNSYCLNDPDYCMKRVKKTPVRTGTTLSELVAAPLPFSDKQSTRIQRGRILEHDGPVDNDSPLNESLNSQSLASDQEGEPQADFPTPLRERSYSKGEMMERMDKPRFRPEQLISYKNDAQTALPDHGSTEPQQPSPKKVHFDSGKQQPSWPGASQPLGQSDQNEMQGNITKGNADLLQSDSSSDLMVHPPLLDALPKEHIQSSLILMKPLDLTPDPKDNSSVINDPPLGNSRPAGPPGVDGTDKIIQSEHNNGASGGEGSREAVNTEPQKQKNTLTIEAPNVPETQPQGKILIALPASETCPRGVKRFLRSLCCFASGD
jgi:serine/threonine protein kinase